MEAEVEEGWRSGSIAVFKPYALSVLEALISVTHAAREAMPHNRGPVLELLMFITYA